MPDLAGRVLVVGATGNLGGKVVDELLRRGKDVRAVVRPASDATRLAAKGVEVVRGDMLDLGSLVAAMTDVDSVVTTAAGYTRRSRQATDIDTVGNTNLAEAASRTGVRRFVLTSILTCEQTPDVSHFWHKKLAEDALEERGVPFVALRPGAFLDQVSQIGGDPFEKRRLLWFGTSAVPLTFVLTSDLAGYLAAAVDAPARDGERVDIGWDRPVTMHEVASLASELIGQRVKVRAVPAGVMRTVARLVPSLRDMTAMVDWFATGRYVADVARQTQLFGPPPTATEAVAHFAQILGHSPAR